MPLTELQVAVLAFERSWWTDDMPKHEAIAARFDLDPAQYQAVLDDLVDLPEAEAHDPLLVRRLRRWRSHRAHEREIRRTAPGGRR